jgi:hypothetical protein
MEYLKDKINEFETSSKNIDIRDPHDPDDGGRKHL